MAGDRLLEGKELEDTHQLLRECGYDFNEVHPECYRNFSYVKLAEILRTRTSQLGQLHANEVQRSITLEMQRDHLLANVSELEDGAYELRSVLANQLEMMSALHQLMRGFLAPDPLAQGRLSARIQATRTLTENENRT